MRTFLVIFLSHKKLPAESKTSRDRSKSASYPRFKSSKKTSKCQVFSFTVLENRKFYSKKLHTQKNGPSGALKGGALWRFSTSILSQNIKKLKGEIIIFGKILTVPNKTERGPFGVFQHPFCRKTAKKLKGTFWGKIFREKSLAVPKKNWKDPLASPGIVCYAGKQEKPFWFSSLDQIVQFGAIIFCRTFKNYFGQFVWIEKIKKSHYNSRVSLHEAPTKNAL